MTPEKLSRTLAELDVYTTCVKKMNAKAVSNPLDTVSSLWEIMLEDYHGDDGMTDPRLVKKVEDIINIFPDK